MSQALVIVESPSKARTITKYLSRDYLVKASLGHVRDLPPKELGVDVEHGFEPKYVTIKGKEKVLRELKAAAKKADEILLAPDPDREGEAIAWHIVQALGVKDKPIRRISFNEITKRAVTAALQNPEELDHNKFKSQQARRILDRLVGYKLSPLLWKKVRRGLSAGRVQSVAVRLVVEREEGIEAFVPEEFWDLFISLKADQPPVFVAKLATQNGKKIKITNAEQAATIKNQLQAGEYLVRDINRKTQKKRPLPPFITSTLQQVASRRLRMSPANIMRIAQQLYEGIDVNGDGPVGLITYMRTDSVRVAPEAQAMASDFIQRSFGKEYLPDKPNVYRSRKGAQEAHEAVRPTSLDLPPERVKDKLSSTQLKVYDLIWRRFLASQMSPAVYEVTSVQIENGDFGLSVSEQKELFAGHLAAMRDDEANGQNDENEAKLPPLQQSQKLTEEDVDSLQKFTQPLPRYTEATLIRELEEKGIGRPSTYAAILTTILEKKYVEKTKGTAKTQEAGENGKKVVKGGLKPTDLGRSVTSLLVASFPDVLNVAFTAWMEDQLDRVEEGQTEWHKLLEEFWQKFSADLERALKEMKNLKKEGEKTDITCEKCGGPMVIKYGRNGPFLACSAFPDCRNTKNFVRDEEGKISVVEPKIVEQKCEKCGSPMLEKRGRYGPFLACSNYPECKNIVSLKGNNQAGFSQTEAVETDKKCPTCEGKMLLKTSRRGGRFYSCAKYPKCKGTLPFETGVDCPREGCGGELVERSGPKGVFWGCNNYPECRVTYRAEPVSQPCPKCGGSFLLRKKRESEIILACPVRECDYEIVEQGEEKSGSQEE